MTWMKRIGIGVGAGAAVLLVAGLLAPEKYREEAARKAAQAKPRPAFRVEDGVTGKLVTFPSDDGSERATFTLDCSDEGEIEGFSLALDQEPSSPPPLRGVFGEFSFPQEPRDRIELGYFTKGMWAPREGQEGQVRQIARRFAAGERLTFTLADPNGSGRAIAWSAPEGFAVPGCRT